MSAKKIRGGVIGVGRGQSFMQGAAHTGMELVAICDTWKERLNKVGKRFKVATYADYDRFLKHDMDAVVLANYCHDHAPFAVKALNAGLHVMSECIAARTMAQCAELVEAVEKTGKIYMLAENYPYMLGCQELRRVYRTGEIGDVQYAEGEYNHPAEENWRLSISPGMKHWRNWLPPTYYVTHALAPLMYITDTLPVSLNALSVPAKRIQAPNTVKIGDFGGVILCRMDNGSVFRIWGLGMSSIHRIRYEVHGDNGMASSLHGGEVRVHHEPWLRHPGQPVDRTYQPDWPEHGDLAAKAGHGGGDFWTNFHFANAIRDRKQPYLNVYRAAAMAAVSILGWRSCLENGKPFAIPDFKSKAARKPYADDNWSPFPEDAGPGQPPASLNGNLKPSAKAIAHARKVWKSIGYKGV
ncbi:MAG: Gfo/Idh/MocA family oxidoreductase [Lentisphaerae bacterium]|nr:Gfo/Idh/MocA family oxidoreductase [Lentisphaerota bacterium]